MNKTAAVEILFVKLSPLPQPTPAVCLVTVTYLLFHKQQQQLHHWRANHPGSSRTLRKSRGPLVVLGCAALLKEGGGERKGGGGGGDNRQGGNSITSSLQQPAPNARQPGGTEWEEWVRSIYQLSPSSPRATIQQDATTAVRPALLQSTLLMVIMNTVDLSPDVVPGMVLYLNGWLYTLVRQVYQVS